MQLSIQKHFETAADKQRKINMTVCHPKEFVKIVCINFQVYPNFTIRKIIRVLILWYAFSPGLYVLPG